MTEYEPSFTIDPNEILKRTLAVRIPGLRKKHESQYKPLPPEEEASVLGDVLSKGTGALQYLGETLDKPGRAVRGLLAGRPEELANLIPFSDTMGLTDPAKSTSGRDLLEQYGALGQNTPGLDWGDVAGFGAEVLTDPLSYLTLGGSAIGKAGKIAKAAGVSTKGLNRFKTLGEHLANASPEIVKAAENAAGKLGTTLAEQSGQKLGGAFGLTTGPLGLVGLGGTHVPEMAKGKVGQAAIEALGRVPDIVGKTPFVGPAIQGTMEGAGRLGRALFDYRVKGQTTRAGQTLAAAQTAAAEAARPEALKKWAKLRGDLGDILESYKQSFGDAPLPDNLANSFEKVARMQAEGVDPLEAFKFHDLPHSPEAAQAIQQAVGDFGAAKNDLWDRFLQMGGDSASMHETEGMKHAPRFMRQEAENVERQVKYKGGKPDAAKARVLATKYLPADVINSIYQDPDVAQWTKAMASPQKTIAGKIPTGQVEGTLFPELLHPAATQKPPNVDDLAGVLMKKYGQFLNNAAVSEGVGPADVAKNLAEHLTTRNKAVQFFTNSGKDVYGKFTEDASKYVTDIARRVSDMGAIHQTVANSLVPGGVDLGQVFKDAGLNPTAAMQFFTAKHGPLQQGMGVAPDVANAILSVTKKTENPEWLNILLKGKYGIDNLTKAFKSNVTLPFPNFAVRNFYSGQAMNAFSSEIPDAQHLGSYLKEVWDSRKILKNPGQYRDLLDELAAHRVYDEADLAALGTELGWSLKRAPNPISPAGFRANVTEGIGKAFEDSGKIAGALKTPAEIGANFNRQVEFMNRVPMYLYLRKKLGWSAEAAAQKVRELQVDYSQLAPFEKSTMKRLVPFYTYMRKTVPVMLDQMAQRPGGVTAQTIRASNVGRSENEFIPPYVGEGMSVNLGGDTYLSGLGLPTDQFADLAVRGPTALSTIKRTGQKALAMTNPLLKAPLEVATGQNFFTGRPLTESYRFPTNNLLFNQALYNSPAARAITSTRQLMDERKGPGAKAVNLLTGAKVTDVPGGLAKQQRIAEQKLLTEILQEAPNIGAFTDVYPRHDPKTGAPMPLSPEEEKMYRAYLGLRAKATADKKKQRKKALPASQGTPD